MFITLGTVFEPIRLKVTQTCLELRRLSVEVGPVKVVLLRISRLSNEAESPMIDPPVQKDLK